MLCAACCKDMPDKKRFLAQKENGERVWICVTCRRRVAESNGKGILSKRGNKIVMNKVGDLLPKVVSS